MYEIRDCCLIGSTRFHLLKSYNNTSCQGKFERRGVRQYLLKYHVNDKEKSYQHSEEGVYWNFGLG